MFIRAFGEELEVLHVDSRENHEIIRCYSQEEKREYLILHYLQYEQVKRLLPYYFPLMDNAAFEDYKGCFTENGELYLVFYKGYGRSLRDLLQTENLPLERRMQLGRRLLEKILLWKLPCGIAGQMLAAERILVDGISGSVDGIAFDYVWEGAAETEDDICLFAESVSDLTEVLFRPEIKHGAGTALTEFLMGLKQGEMTTIFHIYEGYCRMCEYLPHECEKEALAVKWKRVYLQCLGWLQQSAGEILLLIAYLSVVVLLLAGMQKQKEEKQKEQAQGVVYTEIGTLPIREAGQK